VNQRASSHPCWVQSLMSLTETELERLTSFLEVEQNTLETVFIATNELVIHIKQTLPECFPLRWPVVRVVQGGSIHKGTAMRSAFDVDIVFLLSMDVETYMEDGTADTLRYGLRKCLDMHDDIKVDARSLEGNMYPILGCSLYSVNFDVLLGVCVTQTGDKANYSASAELKAAQRFVLEQPDYQSALTAARKLSANCVEVINNYVRDEQVAVKQAVLLVKHWRSMKHLPDLRSFTIELIVLSAVHRLRLEHENITCKSIFHRSLILLDLSRKSAVCPRTLRYGHLGLYVRDQWRDWIAGNDGVKRLIIVNPMMPILDVIRSVESAKIKQWSESAQATLLALEDPEVTIAEIFCSDDDSQVNQTSRRVRENCLVRGTATPSRANLQSRSKRSSGAASRQGR